MEEGDEAKVELYPWLGTFPFIVTLLLLLLFMLLLVM